MRLGSSPIKGKNVTKPKKRTVTATFECSPSNKGRKSPLKGGIRKEGSKSKTTSRRTSFGQDEHKFMLKTQISLESETGKKIEGFCIAGDSEMHEEREIEAPKSKRKTTGNSSSENSSGKHTRKASKKLDVGMTNKQSSYSSYLNQRPKKVRTEEIMEDVIKLERLTSEELPPKINLLPIEGLSTSTEIFKSSPCSARVALNQDRWVTNQPVKVISKTPHNIKNNTNPSFSLTAPELKLSSFSPNTSPAEVSPKRHSKTTSGSIQRSPENSGGVSPTKTQENSPLPNIDKVDSISRNEQGSHSINNSGYNSGRNSSGKKSKKDIFFITENTKKKVQGTKRQISPSKRKDSQKLRKTKTEYVDDNTPRKFMASPIMSDLKRNAIFPNSNNIDLHEARINEAVNSSTRATNIKVVARFRPLNYVEMDLISAGMGRPCCLFEENSRNIIFEEEHLTFSMDNVFSPQGRQENIYNFIAKETIEDVLNGYNGTIFAYGQTGSGKTYTMFGPDLYDTELMGIIPRAARHIFQKINNCELEVDFEIRCSMLEIYKEKLSDLLPENPNNELKIKESPTRGIYVAGLNEICVVYEEEILDLIEAGNEMRHVSETRANKFSSRSHTIFRIQISQKFPNGSEKRGVLNLVDLAGSEKVGKTGATGETLEEATKINLSLSCIGNVIHALVLKADHVPYRDSKLTRILQECLGGNYKTSLVVTCSNHSFHKEETISSLRFAQRARSIKNQVKMNIKSSPEQLQAIIHHLKTELSKTKKENSILRLRLEGAGSISRETERTSESRSRASNEYKMLITSEDGIEVPSFKVTQESNPNSADELDVDDTLIHNSPSQTYKYKTKSFAYSRKPLISPKVRQPGHKLGEFTGASKHIIKQLMREKRSRRGVSESRIFEGEEDIRMMEEYSLMNTNMLKIGYDSDNANNSQQITELIHQSDLDRMKITSLRAEIDCLVREKQELRDELQKYKHESTKYKKKCIAKERTMQEITEKKKSVKYEKLSNTRMDKHHEVEIETLKSQLKSLKDSLIDAENECIRLLKERQEIFEGSYDQFRDIPFFDLKLTEYLRKEKFQNDLSEKKWMRGMKETGMKVKAEDPWEESIFKNIIYIPLEESKVLERNKYGEEITQAMSGMSHEAHIYLLRGQLSEAGILNHNLKRVICALHWRVVIESGKGKIKTDLADTLQDNLEHLHSLLERTQNSHQTLRQRMEKFEFEMMDLRHKYHDAANNCVRGKYSPKHNNKLSSSFIGKSRILKTFSKHVNKEKGDNAISRTIGKGRRLMTLNRLGIYSHLGSKYNPGGMSSTHIMGNTSSFVGNSEQIDYASYKLGYSQQIMTEESIPIIVELGEPEGLKDTEDLTHQLLLKSNTAHEGRTSEFTSFPPTIPQPIRKGSSEFEQNLRCHKLFETGENTSSFGKRYSGSKDPFEYNISGMETLMLDEIEKLEDKVICVQNELQLQTGRAEQIMAGYNDLKKQVKTLRFANSELQAASQEALQQENESWQNKMNELNENSTRELRRKQRELGKLHEHLAEWVIKYMDLEKETSSHTEDKIRKQGDKGNKPTTIPLTVNSDASYAKQIKGMQGNVEDNLNIIQHQGKHTSKNNSESYIVKTAKMVINAKGDMDNNLFDESNTQN